MDEKPFSRGDAPLQITLYGTARGKMVAAIAHGYFMAVCKLGLNAATESAPWRKVPGSKPQDYFTWRKMVVEEQNACKATISELLGFDVPDVHVPPWPLIDGRTVYDAQLAGQLAHEFAMYIVGLAGLGRG